MEVDIRRTRPRKVDFLAHATDLLAYMMATAGYEDSTIENKTGLSDGQVKYRLRKAEQQAREKAKREGKVYLSARKLYRKGLSPVSRIVMSQITADHSQVKKFVTQVLEKRGLYSPHSNGVLKNK